MRRIAIINQKGGVGKTTTAVNLGSALARAGRRVLLVDLDPQSHLTLHVGVDPATKPGGIYEALTQSTPLAQLRKRIRENLWLIGSHIDLAAAEVELVSVVGREGILRDLLDADSADYDYIIMDCPPSLGVLTLNALAAAEEVFIPLQPHYLALHGLSKLLETVSLVCKRINPALRVTGIVVCMHEAGTRLATEVLEDVASFLRDSETAGQPWSGARVFRSVIRRNIKLAECPSHGLTIFDYAPASNGAEDYAALATEVCAMVEPVPSPKCDAPTAQPTPACGCAAGVREEVAPEPRGTVAPPLPEPKCRTGTMAEPAIGPVAGAPQPTPAASNDSEKTQSRALTTAMKPSRKQRRAAASAAARSVADVAPNDAPRADAVSQTA